MTLSAFPLNGVFDQCRQPRASAGAKSFLFSMRDSPQVTARENKKYSEVFWKRPLPSREDPWVERNSAGAA